MIPLIQGFAGLTVAFAGLSIGLCAIIISRYWVVWKQTANSERLLPSHIILIGMSYSMIAIVAVTRLGTIPRFRHVSFEMWWVYPFITLAFLIGDVGLVIILKFISERGSRIKQDRERQ